MRAPTHTNSRTHHQLRKSRMRSTLANINGGINHEIRTRRNSQTASAETHQAKRAREKKSLVIVVATAAPKRMKKKKTKKRRNLLALFIAIVTCSEQRETKSIGVDLAMWVCECVRVYALNWLAQ